LSPTAIWGELICVKKLITVLSLVLFLQIAHPAESENKTATGLTRIQFVTDVNQVVPGEEITVALVLKPDTDFHIYWRGPALSASHLLSNGIFPRALNRGLLNGLHQ